MNSRNNVLLDNGVDTVIDVVNFLADIYKEHPDWQWPLIWTVIIVIIFLWKIVEIILPKIIGGIINVIRQRYSSTRIRAALDTAIREFTVRMQTPNWLTCVRSLAKYHINVPLPSVYHPLHFRFLGDRREYISTNIEKILTENKVFAIVGPPGSGKSTVMSLLAIAYAQETMECFLGIKEGRLPLFYSLKNLPDKLAPISNVITDALANVGCIIDGSFIKEQLSAGHCIVLLDGLDEVGDDVRRRIVVDWIIKAMSAFPKNRFIVSCRSTEWDLARLPNIPEAHILPLSNEDIVTISTNWENYCIEKTGKISEKGGHQSESLSAILQKPENRSLQSLAKNPLLLTIMIILHLNNEKLPNRKVDLYDVFIRTLLGEWDEVKNLETGDASLRIAKRLKFFQRVSLHLLEETDLNERIDLRLDPVFSFISTQLNDVINDNLNPTGFLDSVARRSGLIYNAGEGQYLFNSRGFLEFLAAKELSDTQNYNSIVRHLSEEMWYECIVQFSSLLPDATEFVTKHLLESNIRKNVFHFRILAHILKDTVSLDSETKKKSILLVNDCLTHLLSEGKIFIETIKDIYSLDPTYWRNELRCNLLEPTGPIRPEIACEVLATIEDESALNVLREEVKSVTPSVKAEIIKSLGHSLLPESMDILWDLVEDADVDELAVTSLCSHGEMVIRGCRKILDDHSSIFKKKTAAVKVLCQIKTHEAIEYLMDLMKDSPKELFHNIAVSIGRTYFREWRVEEEKIKNAFWLKGHSRYVAFIKRPLDVLLSSLIILLEFPMLIIISLLIKITSPGPVFYRSKRIGKDGIVFSYFKFRTINMVFDEATSAVWTSNNDPRVTPIGKILRRTGLSEIPAFLNVLKGDISLVGPRPERPEFHNSRLKIFPIYNNRLNIRPGLTGLAKINYIYGDSVEDEGTKLVYDIYYVSHCSFLLDLKIFVKTMFPSSFFRNGI